jgi:isocitrate dehydrogenase (NAD+)
MGSAGRVLIIQTIAEGKHITRDLGGKAGTKEYTDAILAKLSA